MGGKRGGDVRSRTRQAPEPDRRRRGGADKSEDKGEELLSTVSEE